MSANASQPPASVTGSSCSLSSRELDCIGCVLLSGVYSSMLSLSPHMPELSCMCTLLLPATESLLSSTGTQELRSSIHVCTSGRRGGRQASCLQLCRGAGRDGQVLQALDGLGRLPAPGRQPGGSLPARCIKAQLQGVRIRLRHRQPPHEGVALRIAGPGRSRPASQLSPSAAA